jgi:hypothetical protein
VYRIRLIRRWPWLHSSSASFMQYDLGFFEHQTQTLTGAKKPSGAKVLPMSPV